MALDLGNSLGHQRSSWDWVLLRGLRPLTRISDVLIFKGKNARQQVLVPNCPCLSSPASLLPSAFPLPSSLFHDSKSVSSFLRCQEWELLLTLPSWAPMSWVAVKNMNYPVKNAGSTCRRGWYTWGKAGTRSRDYMLGGFWKLCFVGERWQMAILHPGAFSLFNHLAFVHNEETWVVSLLLFSFQWAPYEPHCVNQVGLVCCDSVSCLFMPGSWPTAKGLMKDCRGKN